MLSKVDVKAFFLFQRCQTQLSSEVDEVRSDGGSALYGDSNFPCIEFFPLRNLGSPSTLYQGRMGCVVREEPLETCLVTNFCSDLKMKHK